MTTRSVIVELQARVGSYVSNIDKAKQSTNQLADAQDKAGKSTDQTSQAQERASESTQKNEQSTKRSAAALAQEAAAAQSSAKALGLQYNASGQLTDANGKVLNSSQAAAQGLGHFSDAVYLTAHAAEEAGESAIQASTGFSRLAETANTNRDSWEKAGGALTVAGVGIVAALGATAKASMDWESAWAGVTKTIDGSPEQMAELETGLRGLAKTLPITHTEIAGVAEAAGQLGVARKDVLGFTKTMIDLGVSTNLTAEDAATNIAQISNVMGTMTREGSMGVARFGSALVALGNDGASTEAEILAMAQRIAGAGATVGATEVEVLALSNTLASMGVQAELGGGVTTRVLLKMYSAVETGGGVLEAFARTAGTSASDFSKAFRESPVEAMNLVAQGLNRVKQEGGNVVQAMTDMGISGTQETQVMLSLANSGTLLTDSLVLGSKAWQENTALIDEATKRYDTADSRIKIAWNNIKDAAISAGAVLLPVISSLADGVSDLASFFGDLPAPVQGALTIMAGLVGVTALLAGGFLVMFPRVMDVVGAFKTLGVSGADVGGKLKGLGKALGIAGIALAAAAALRQLHNSMQPAVQTTQDMTQALLKLKNTGAVNALDDVFKGIDPGTGGDVLKDVNNIGDALARIEGNGFKDAFGKFGSDVLKMDNDFTKMNKTIANLDTSMGGMVSSGNFETAAQGFQAVAKSAEEQGIGLETVAGYFPAYISSLQEVANGLGVNVEKADLYKWAMGEVPKVVQEAEAAQLGLADSTGAAGDAQADASTISEEFAEHLAEVGLSAEGTILSLDKFTDALVAAGLSTMSSREAAFEWESSMRGLGASIEEVVAGQGELGAAVNGTGTDFDKMTESGKAANGVFQGIIQEGLGVAQVFSKDINKSAAEVNEQLHATYDAGIAAAKGFGLGDEAAEALVRTALQIPTDISIETWMSEQALIMSGNTEESVTSIPDSVHIETSMDQAAYETAGKTKQAAEDIPNQETIDSWMSDAAFIEAIRTRAAAEGIPPDVAVASFMESAARNEADDTTARILNIPRGASVTSFMDSYARNEAERLSSALNAVDGRHVQAYATYTEVTNKIVNESLNKLRTGDTGGATGGRVSDLAEGYAGGGRVPGSRSANIAKDNVLGMVNGRPFGLQGTEWIINPRSSDTYDDELAAINEGSFPKGVLSGAVSAGREWAAPAPGPSSGSAGAGPSTVSLHPDDRALLRAVASVADRPLVAMWNGREVLTAVRRSEQAAKQGA